MNKEHKNKIAKALKGNKNALGFKHTDETKERMSNGQQNMSEEAKKLRSERLRKANTGYRHTDEAKKKMSIAKSNPTNETRKKLSIAAKNRKFNKETRLKMSKSHKGFKHTNDSKQLMSEVATGRVFSDEHKENLSKARRKRKTTVETRIKMMQSAKRGKDHPNWQGGISYGQYCPRFNEKVKEEIRDKYMNMCVLCGMTNIKNGRELDVHHIDYNKSQGCNGHEWRLIPLCKSCHAKTNSNRKMYEKRIKIILEVI